MSLEPWCRRCIYGSKTSRRGLSSTMAGRSTQKLWSAKLIRGLLPDESVAGESPGARLGGSARDGFMVMVCLGNAVSGVRRADRRLRQSGLAGGRLRPCDADSNGGDHPGPDLFRVDHGQDAQSSGTWGQDLVVPDALRACHRRILGLLLQGAQA